MVDKKGRRLRFSLRTLMLFVLLAGSGVALCRNLAPWQPVNKPGSKGFTSNDRSRDGQYIELNDARTEVQVRDATGTVLGQFDVRESVQTARLSWDGKQIVICTSTTMSAWIRSTISVWDTDSGECLSTITMRYDSYLSDARFSTDGQYIRSFIGDRATYWHRRRPEQWWGVACLAEFWLFALLLIGFIWSCQRDSRHV